MAPFISAIYERMQIVITCLAQDDGSVVGGVQYDQERVARFYFLCDNSILSPSIQLLQFMVVDDS